MEAKCLFCKYNIWSGYYKENCYPLQYNKKNRYTGITYRFDGETFKKEKLNSNGKCVYYKDCFIIRIVKILKKRCMGE